jgi:Protein of unknown function (DUF664)
VRARRRTAVAQRLLGLVPICHRAQGARPLSRRRGAGHDADGPFASWCGRAPRGCGSRLVCGDFCRRASGSDVGRPWIVPAARKRHRGVCRTIADAASSLDELSVIADEYRGNVSLRWILVHMVEETARHAGHLDLTPPTRRRAPGASLGRERRSPTNHCRAQIARSGYVLARLCADRCSGPLLEM